MLKPMWMMLTWTKPRGDRPPPVAPFAHRRPPEAAEVVDGPGAHAGAAATVGDLDQVDDHVDRDQHHRRREGTEAARRPDRVADHAGALAGALRTAHADRGRGHAVGADRPPAGGAGDGRLAVRDVGNRSGPRSAEPTIAPDGARQPRPPLRHRGRRAARRARHRRLLLRLLVRLAGDARPHPRRPPHERLAEPALGRRSARSACCSRAPPRAPTPSAPACSSPPSASGA